MCKKRKACAHGPRTQESLAQSRPRTAPAICRWTVASSSEPAISCAAMVAGRAAAGCWRYRPPAGCCRYRPLRVGEDPRTDRLWRARQGGSARAERGARVPGSFSSSMRMACRSGNGPLRHRADRRHLYY